MNPTQTALEVEPRLIRIPYQSYDLLCRIAVVSMIKISHHPACGS